jgi:hypothetical protein
MDARTRSQRLRKRERTHVVRVFAGLAASRLSMVPPFDIFKRQPGGSVRWLEVVADLEAAKLRVKELVECVPGEYFIFSLASGRRLDVKRDEVRDSSESVGTQF